MVTSFSDLKGKNRHKNLADIYTGQQTLEPAAPATPQPYQLGGVDVGIDPWGLGVTQSLMPQPLTQGGLPLAEPVPPMPVGGGIPRGEPVPAKPQVNNLKKLKPNPNTPVTPAVAPVTSPAPETPDFNYLPSQAIIEKFQGARNALDAAKEANELANDPELTKAKANNDLMSSIFAGNAAQIGSTFGKDMSQQTAALKDSFKASNAAMDAQLTQADRMAKEADLNARQAALGADEEKSQLENLKQQIGITADKQTVQLNALKLVADSKSLQELDNPVPEVQLKLLASKGLNVPPGTTNRQLKGMSDMFQSEMAYKNQLALENVRARNQENLELQKGAKQQQQKNQELRAQRQNKAYEKLTEQAIESHESTTKAAFAAKSTLDALDKELSGKFTKRANWNDIPLVGGAMSALLPATRIKQLATETNNLAMANRNALAGKDGNMNAKEFEGAVGALNAPGATVGQIRDAIELIHTRLQQLAERDRKRINDYSGVDVGPAEATSSNNQNGGLSTPPPLTSFDAWKAGRK